MKIKKMALFAFNGEMMCFVHVLLNALDLHTAGYDVRVIIEGAATKLVPELAAGDHGMSPLYQKVAGAGLLEGACRACSAKMGVAEAVESAGLALLGDMQGHPGMANYLDDGYQVITF